MIAGTQTSRRDALLREMGLGPVWRLRRTADEAQDDIGVATQAVESSPQLPREELAPSRSDIRARARVESPAKPLPEDVAPPSADDAISSVRAQRIASLQWDALEEDMRACRACGLCEQRRQAVPGVGDRNARWMFVGEGPGSEEDLRGEPFVGPAGRLLDNMLGAIGLDRRHDVFIANAVKCRPPHNRTPQGAELDACLPYLQRQIELVRPRLLVALGRPAAQALLNREIAISAARGKRFERNGVPVMVTYHPAYLLRNPQDKAKAWEDLCFGRRLMAGACASD